MDNAPVQVTQKDIQLAVELDIPAAAIPLLKPLQLGWIGLSKKKTDLTEALIKAELAVQATLLNIEQEKDLPKIQLAISTAKNQAAAAKERRLLFTRMLDERMIGPLMLFEKNNDELIAKASKYELATRSTAATVANKVQLKATEEAQYKAHIVNEYLRVAADYRLTLENRIMFYYKQSLERKTEVSHIPALKQDIKGELPNIELVPFVKFARSLVTDVEAVAIFNAIAKYDPAPDLAKAIEQVDTQFSLYANDLKNATVAIASVEEQIQQRNAEVFEAVSTEVAVNTLIASAGVPQINVPKVKKSVAVVVDGTSEAWAMAVIGNGTKNWQVIKTYLKVKSWDKLSLGHIAVALGKLKTDFPDTEMKGIIFEDVEK